MTQQSGSMLKIVGGKKQAAHRIIATFPDPATYSTYVEPCGGAAHVLLHKPPYNHKEVYNDINFDLVNFWRQVQEQGTVLAQRLGELPYSRELYYEYYCKFLDGGIEDPLERAICFFYVLRGTGTGWIRPSPTGWNNSVESASAYRSSITLFEIVQRRITQPRLLIDNRDIMRVIEEYDSPLTLFYIDPPYVGAEWYYSCQIGVLHQVS